MPKKFEEEEAKPVAQESLPATPSAKLLTIEQLAVKYGEMQPVIVSEDSPYSSAHLCAAQLNGWEYHKLYVGGDVTMSDEDYLAAIAAAKLGKAHPPVHKGGISDEQAEAQHKAALEAQRRAAAAAAKGGR